MCTYLSIPLLLVLLLPYTDGPDQRSSARRALDCPTPTAVLFLSCNLLIEQRPQSQAEEKRRRQQASSTLSYESPKRLDFAAAGAGSPVGFSVSQQPSQMGLCPEGKEVERCTVED